MNTNNGSSDAHSQIVKLNVGGKKFVTTQQTLQSKGENFLSALLDNIVSGKITCVYDEQGNGKIFEYVLEYFRTGRVFIPDSIPKEQLEHEFDFYSIPKEILQTEAERLALQSKWRTQAEMFFKMYWSFIAKELSEIVDEFGLNNCTLTLIHQDLSRSHFIPKADPQNKKRSFERYFNAVQRYYNNIQVTYDPVSFQHPLKPLFLDNLLYILRDFGFYCSYVNRQQTVEISLVWVQFDEKVLMTLPKKDI